MKTKQSYVTLNVPLNPRAVLPENEDNNAQLSEDTRVEAENHSKTLLHDNSIITQK